MCHSGALKPIMHTEWDFFKPRWMNAFAKLLTYQKEGCWNWNWMITFIQHLYCPPGLGKKPVGIEIGQSLFFLIILTCSSYSAKVHFTHCPFLFAARAVLSGTWYESWCNSCERLEENNGLHFFISITHTVHLYPCHSVLEHGPHRHSGIGGGWMRWMATDLSQEYYYKVTSLRSFIWVNKKKIRYSQCLIGTISRKYSKIWFKLLQKYRLKNKTVAMKIRIFESYLDQHLNSSIRPTGCQAACR